MPCSGIEVRRDKSSVYKVAGQFRQKVDAVSYTHLDVYKRQVWDGRIKYFDIIIPYKQSTNSEIQTGVQSLYWKQTDACWSMTSEQILLS